MPRRPRARSSSSGRGPPARAPARTATASGGARSGSGSSASERSARAWKSGRGLLDRDDRDVVRQHRVERVRGRAPAAGRRRPSTEATCPRACTPVSVRPATASSPQRGKTVVERLAERRPRPSAARAAAPSRGSRCRRTRASASSFRSRPRSLEHGRRRVDDAKYDLYGEEFRADPLRRLRADARARSGLLPARHRRRDADLVRHPARGRRGDARSTTSASSATRARADRGGARRGCVRGCPRFAFDREPHAQPRRRRPPSPAPSRHEGVHAADGRAAAAADPGDRRRAARRGRRTVGRWISRGVRVPAPDHRDRRAARRPGRRPATASRSGPTPIVTPALAPEELERFSAQMGEFVAYLPRALRRPPGRAGSDDLVSALLRRTRRATRSASRSSSARSCS